MRMKHQNDKNCKIYFSYFSVNFEISATIAQKKQK